MAIAHTIPSPLHMLPTNSMDGVQSVELKEYAIGGKLVTITMVLDEPQAMTFKDEEGYRAAVKQKIVAMFADYIIQNKLVEVNYVNDPYAFSMSIRVHGYLAPNDQVKVVRQMQPVRTKTIP